MPIPPSLRRRGALCLLVCTCLGLGGCAFMSDEDRDFYGKGWVNPRELDTPMQHHVMPNPEAPVDPIDAPAVTGNPPRPAHDDEWVAPPVN